jgi:hypothetical protein
MALNGNVDRQLIALRLLLAISGIALAALGWWRWFALHH